MSKTYLIVPDQHAHPEHNNDRADYLAKLTTALRPDVVVNMGDAADMQSLSSYDRNKRSFHGRSYRADIDAHLEFQERWWGPVKATKKKLPYRIVLEGNHEERIERALDVSPELENTIGFQDLEFDRYYDETIRYDGQVPGVLEKDGILFAHYFVTGVSGRPLGGERPAHLLLNKNGASCIAAHSHTLDFASRKTVGGATMNALIAGCYQDYINSWAGTLGKMWRPGVAILRNVEEGNWDFQWISLEALAKEFAPEGQKYVLGANFDGAE